MSNFIIYDIQSTLETLTENENEGVEKVMNIIRNSFNLKNYEIIKVNL